MITREEIRELAQLRVNGEPACALSFYFAPGTPQNKSHRGETILVKDLVREAWREAEKIAKKACPREDLDRILAVAENLHGNQSRAKAIFACGAKNFWREFDLPPQLSATEVFVKRQFDLKPLARLLGTQRRVWVALVDRQKARFFDFRLNEMKEFESLFRTPPFRQGRGDGFAGYDGGHAQRRVQDEALHHFKDVADHLLSALEGGGFEKLIIGCQDINWHELDPHLHPYVRQRMIGRFAVDVSKVTPEEVKEQATRILQESVAQRQRELVRQVLDQARSNQRGVTGLRRVLRSLELGEVQTLFIGDGFSHGAVECTNCGHIDAHLVRYCPACGRETRELQDVSDGIIPVAIRRDIELFYVNNDSEFDRAGNIAALLRFRADHSKGNIIPAAS
jgi:peptide chain release factor subunit 1